MGAKDRCGRCDGCQREDCGECFECLHKKKFGGDGSSKQRCMNRICLVHSTGDGGDLGRDMTTTNPPVSASAAMVTPMKDLKPPAPETEEFSEAGDTSISTPRSSIARKRCGECEGCLRDDCGMCSECQRKSKFGGDGTSRQVCKERRCLVIKSVKGEKIVYYDDADEAQKKKRSKPTPASMTDSSSEASSTAMEAIREPYTIGNLFKAKPAPTNIASAKHQVLPNLTQDHSNWGVAMEPQNTAPLTAAASFKARTEPLAPPKPKVVLRKMAVVTPASTETKSKLYRLKREMGRDVQMVTDEGESDDIDHSETTNSDEGEEGSEEGSEATGGFGRWTLDEQLLFLIGLKQYGSHKYKWKMINGLVTSR